MLRNLDRFASAATRSLRVGQTLRLPPSVGTRAPHHLHVVESFPARREQRHCVTVRHLGTGQTRVLAQHHLEAYLD